jgi:hypothetical protein
MQSFIVCVPEFRWEGRVLNPGDCFQALDTMEIGANLALGRIRQAADSPSRPQPYVEADEIPALPLRVSPDGKRRYLRRDMKAD